MKRQDQKEAKMIGSSRVSKRVLRSISNSHASTGMTEFMDCTSALMRNEKQGPVRFFETPSAMRRYRDLMVLYEKQ